MAKQKSERRCPAGTVALGVDETVETAYQIVGGRVQIEWKWDTWENFYLQSPFVFGALECIERAKSTIRVQANEDTVLRPLSAEELSNPEDPELAASVLQSLTLFSKQIVHEGRLDVGCEQVEVAGEHGRRRTRLHCVVHDAELGERVGVAPTI